MNPTGGISVWLGHMLHWANKQLAVLFVSPKVVRYDWNPFDSDALVLTRRLVDMILLNKLVALPPSDIIWKSLFSIMTELF
jgi:hypothetical protein